MTPTGGREREDRLLPNAWLVARREFGERVRSRIFYVSTGFLALLAITVAMMPLLVRVADRGTTTTVAVVTPDDRLANQTIPIMDGILGVADRASGETPKFSFVWEPRADGISGRVADGEYDGALLVSRTPAGRIDFQFLTGEGIGTDRAQLVQVGTLAVAMLDYAAGMQGGDRPFLTPGFVVAAVAGPSAGGQPIGASEYAGRRIVGVVFVILIFITLVIYGMWVAAAVVAEKSSRVMELLISAASPRQLVIGKVVGIGLAGLVQYVAVLVCGLGALLLEEQVAASILGSQGGAGVSLAVLTPALLVAYGAFWILGFVLYSLVYAAAGSLVSRAEDLQVIALPLSILAIAGYLVAVTGLTGGIGSLVRLASFVPFWSPFVMMTRLTVGRTEPWEVGLAIGLMVVAIAVVGIVAVRVYAAGVLLYGQRPSIRAITAAILRPPA